MGNLYLVVNVQPHKFFQRRENDILLNLDINIAQAVLGAEIEVPTVNGKENLNPAGTQPGKIFTLKTGRALYPQIGRGDELVIVNVDIPTKLTKEPKILSRNYRNAGTAVKPKEKGFLDWLNEALGG